MPLRKWSQVQEVLSVLAVDRWAVLHMPSAIICTFPTRAYACT